MDTIFALSTAKGKAGVSIIRISGSKADKVFDCFNIKKVAPRNATLRTLKDNDEIIDHALILYFEENSSFTGEKTIEIQCHGSIAIVKKILSTLNDIDGFREAEPGEFSRRAFENSNLDLVQIEALNDLIAAETEAQRRLAMKVFSGRFSEQIESWRSMVLEIRALIEACIDFSDEELPEEIHTQIYNMLSNLIISLQNKLEESKNTTKLSSGFEIAIIGSPNVGKSSFLNYLVGRDVAITSHEAGTTRDIIEVKMDLEGIPVTFLDTAGIRETTNEIEKMGVERAKNRAEMADIRLFLTDENSLPEEFNQIQRPCDFTIFTKNDLFHREGLSISIKTGEGIKDVLDQIAHSLSSMINVEGLISTERQQTTIKQILPSLNRSIHYIDSSYIEYEFIAAELQNVVYQFDNLIGRIDVEDVLGKIFSNFCIGK